MRKVNSLGNRLVALALSIVMVLGMFPVGTVTAVGNGVYGNVTTLTGGSVTGNGTENVEVMIEDTTLQWSAADNSIGRYQDGWWVGIDVVAPDGYSADATYKVKNSPTAEYGEAKSFADNKDGEKNIGLWFPVSPESLKKFASEGRNLTMTYAFDWDGDKTYEQTIVFSVDPTGNIVLKKDSVQVYPVAGTVSTLTGGAIIGNGTANVEVIIEETTLQWSAADNSIGRYQDGWWVGIDVVAPDGYSANATYKVKTNPTAEYGEEQSFADNKDGEKNIGLWFPVSPESLTKFASEGRNLTMTYAFDWDADDSIDQTVVFSVKPSTKIVLQKDGKVVYPLGTVTTLTGGSVSGNGTENVEVMIEATTLQWVAANNLRAEGWWVGIDVVAPAYFNQNATYKVKSNPTAEYGAAKSFTDNKDGEKNIQLWFAVSPESLAKFASEGRNLTMTYTFDWDGDGTYEQTVVFSVKPSASIVLKKGDVQHYPAVGTVNPLTGDYVTVDGTTEIEVVIHNATLQWSPADNTIGRYQDGWWVGIDVIAPDYVADNATYKVKTNPAAEYGEAKSFAANKDGDKNIGLWFPVSPESLKKFADETRYLTMTYTFDWDGDGVYDQTIKFSVNPFGNIQLKKGTVHYYPELGDVTTYTGGTVTGNKTSDVSVVIEDTVLQWSPADPSIGRNQDGWWVGIKVTVPENYEPVLMGAKYQTKSNPNIDWNDITEVESFWDNKDDPYYIQLWFPVTPASLEKFKNENRNITMMYRFDWEGDGEYDQTITFSVVPSDKIVLTKVEQTGFAFVEPNPVDKWVGESYTNTASGGQGTGAVTYAITSGADVADIDTATGKLTFKKVGTVTVTATKAADDTYAEVTASYTVKSIKYPQAEFKFENSNSPITLGFATGSFTNVAGGGSGEGTVTYSIVAGSEFATIDATTGKVTFIKAGSVTVLATKAADANYIETTATYTLVIEKSAQSNLELSDSTPSSIVYNTAAQSVISVSGGNGNGGVTYSIIEGNKYAIINSETGAITTLKAGGSFTVQVNKAGDDGYNAATPITKTIYVDYADQKDFVFATKTPADVTFNDNSNKFTNTASGGLGTGAITYAFKDAASDAIADIDATTGELTILASGTITVVATKAGDDCYNAITAEYTLKVEKDTPEFTVGDVQLVYGATEHQINVNTILAGSGKYVYSIEGTNNIGADVDANGKVTFENSTGKVGTITIKVKKEADTQYVEAEKTFTLTVSYHQPTAQPTVNGDTKNESGWYTGVVTIYAPEGYQISYGNDLTGTTWSDTVTVNTDGDNAKNVYLMKGNEISDAISFESIKIDTAAPVNVDIKYDTSFLETVLQAITFGIYQADEVTVTLTATDTTSGVDYFTYSVGGEDVVVNKADFTKNENGVAEYEFKISAQFRNKVTMKVTDVAGWTSEWTETEHTLVVDTISPVLDVKYEFAGSQNMGEIIYSNKDVTVKFAITESNFDLRKNDPVFKVGSMTVALTWAYDEEAKVWKAEQLLSGDNTYDLSLTYSDESGNAMTEYAQKIIIDSAAPVISSSYGTVVPVKGNIFNTSRTATFTITESNFNAQDVVLTVIAKDITGADVDISAKGYAAYAQNPDNWTSNGNVHTITLPAFDIDAVYTVDIAYTDLAKNEATDYAADEFIIDKADANNIKIEYSTSIVDKILETVTFGFYKADVQVTVTAEDITSGVDYFVISYIQKDGANNSNKVSYTTDPITAVQNAENKNVFTATHTITADARGTVSVKVVDNAKNDSDKEDQYVVVADTIAPGLEYKYIFTNDQVREYQGIYYTKGETKVKFTITEANFDLSLKAAADETVAPAPVLTVNDVAQDITWTQIAGTDKWETEITLTGNDDYVIELSYTDRSTNAMATYTKEVHIDNEAPVFDVTYDNNDARNENNYKADRTATVKVTEHNFEPAEVKLTVTAKDITGAAVDISSKAYADYAKNPANWTQTGDVWTLNTVGMEFDIDAIYSVKLEYTDLAENAATTYVSEFVVDKTISSDVTIEYSTSIVDKVLETVTFGLYKGDIVVTVTAKDQTAGVEYFEITYTQVDGANNSNKATYTTEKLAAVQDADDKTVFTATHTIKAEARGKVSVNLIDKAGNTTGKAEEYVVVADTIAPGLEYKYTFTNDQVREYNNIFYTQGETKVKFTITEANFDLSLKAADDESVAPAPVLTVNDVAQDITWTQIEGTDKWETEITLTGNDDYVIKLTYTDRSTNAMETYTKEIHIDNEAPVFDVTYDNNDARNENNYKADRTATVKVTEHNFEPAEVKLTVTAKDITGAAVDISSKAYADYAKNPANWTQTGDVWTLNTAGMEFDIDAIYSVKLEYTDLAENAATTYTADYVIDKTVPANIQIKYSTPISDSWNKILNTVTFGYYPYTEKVEVTLIADDITSGVDFFTWTYTKEANTSDKNKTDETKVINKEDITYSNNGKTATASFVIDAQARGYISVDVTDKAGNTSGKSDDTRINVVDTIAPTRAVSYQAERVLDATTMLDVDTFAEGDNVILYYEKEAVVTFTINEANFYAEDVVIKVNGVQKVPTDWTQNGDVWTGTITISGDGDYVVTMTYTDRSTNKMVAYQSQKIAIDNTDPTIAAAYTSAAEAVNVKYYKADRKAVITIVDHNFIADDVVAVITAVDVQGNKIENADAICAEFANYLKTRSSWTHDGDVHTAEITFSADAQYTFKIDYKDIIGNSAVTYVADPFVVDHEDPTNLKIEYSDSVVEKIIEAITFGFYKPEVIVTLTADDITAGVDYFDWTYTKEDRTSDKNAASNGARITAEDIVYSNNGLTATATFKIPANARGYVSATVTDRAGNNDSKVDDKHINVVDNIAPTISVKYEADNADTMVQFTDKDFVTVESFEKAAIAHYNGNVTAKIVINEANFFEGIEAQDGVIYNVGIKLTKTDDNGNETVYEYLPAGAVQKYAGATPKYITWTTSGDEHSFNINYTDNADYVLEIDYTDLSSNEADISANDGNTATKAYKSKVVTVDKVAPVVSVKYGNEKVIHTIDGRDYFDAEQTATITVEEHNFRADDFVASVIAKNILGDDVNVENFKATLSDDSKWKMIAKNVYQIVITYSVDANYTFDYEYKDLAQNAAAEYTEDIFTVDTTAPENLTVTYSTSVLDKVLESITFGYYNAEMTVTITAEDDTAGIYYFVYSYIKSEGVSDVNKELINDKIEDANSRIVHEGKKSTTSFTIPKLLLANDNQFNGTVKFTAFDRSENNTEKVDNQRIIVDNIAPTATITYNQPVQNANNISYYAGNIDAKIVINEANFYSEDVVVTVTKDGTNYPVSVKWVDDSVDVHTGTFTLTADGDYIVTVEYKDRSNNQMAKYTSNRLTLDTKAPSVSVSNIKNNSANKDEKYGFTITATDINLDSSSFKPVLTATVRKDDGSYETKTVSLGDMKTVEAGKTYTFTVDNLEEDAVYALVCTLKDMSGNQYSKILLSDNESYDEVRFSINRNGSTFAVDKDTDTLVNQYYVYSVDEDVVIEEVNVDPVETYVVKLNGEKLTEGTDYTTTLSNKDGEWSKRTYVISKKLFESEGEYSIVVESTDKADTTAYSDVKNLNVSFVVDQTAPVLTISGLENGGRYQVEEQTVTIIPTDDGGRLYSIKVVVLNSDGEPIKDANGMDISVRFEMSGEEFLTYLTENGGKVTFTVPEGLENQVQIICNDYAVNAEGNTNEFNETFTKVTVSQSQWIIFYANKPLFYGTIAGVVLLVGAIFFLIFFKKRKKEQRK